MPSSASTQQPNISNIPKKDANGKPIPNTSDGTLVRIRLFDDRERVLMFKDNPSPTCKQVINQISQKLELSEDVKSLFSLWIVGHELELQLRPKMEIMEMVDKWPRWVEKYTHTTTPGIPSFKFVYKREAMVSKEQERDCTDEVAIKLLYGEARNNVMAGRYPLSNVNEAAQLAALQLLVTHGLYDAKKHGPGTGFNLQSLAITVPQYMLPKLKNQDWEQKISSAWSNMEKKSAISPYKEFLEYVMKWDCYGSTFFAACKNVPPQGFFELRTDHLMVGVNRNGISILDDDRHKISWYGGFEGVEWECTPDSITIEYRPPVASTPSEGEVPKKMASMLITPQAHLIDSLASRAIYLIEKLEKAKQKKKPGQTRRASATPGLSSPQSQHAPSESTAPASKRISTPKSPSMEGVKTAMITHDEQEDHADYLKAINAARKESNR